MPSLASDLAHYLRSNESVRAELDTTLRVADGELPSALRGVLFRNGPGKQEVYGTRYDHPFDGDGMVTRFAFDGHSVRYRNRFVRTREYVAEERAGRMLFRSFGTNVPGGLRRNLLRLRFKNAANTSVVFHGGKLLALWEGGLPHWLDAETLETRGRYDFAGELRNRGGLIDRLVAPELPFSAHPKTDVDTGELVNFGTLMGVHNQLVSYRVDTGGEMRAPQLTPLDSLSFVHDFVLTANYCVYYLPAIAFRVAATLLGFATPVGSLAGKRGGSATLLLVPRDGRPPMSFPTRVGFVFHFANGYEDAQGRVILDGMRMDSLPSAASIRALMSGEEVRIPPTVPTRFALDLRSGEVIETPLAETLADLPTIDPRRSGRSYRHFWSIAATPGQRTPFYHRVLHFTHAEGDSAAREIIRDFGEDLPGEPLFVPAGPNASEGDGFVLTLVYRADAHRSDLYVLRADDLRTVCRLELPHHIPSGFHGTWVPD